jgi:UPF0755 protein
LRRFIAAVGVLCLVLGGCVVAAAFWWVNTPLPLRTASVELSIEPGTLPRAVAVAAVNAGVDTQAELLYAWFRVSRQDRMIKAGSYDIPAGTTPRRLLSMLVRGEEALVTVVLPEGWTFRQIRAALAKAEQLRADSKDLDAAALMVQLGRPGLHPEGRFFPDTYAYTKGSSDMVVLRRALQAMDRQLDKAWQQRQPGAMTKTPTEALILASIIEKETGQAADRSMVSSVFNNRLRIGMPLQTDPTVIYGLGEAFDGNLRKNDLRTDTPWNTYTRPGLPPTPIAMPGKASLLAAVQPVPSKALYFVARGDGSSQFSATLDAHNRAVNQYQRGGGAKKP